MSHLTKLEEVALAMISINNTDTGVNMNQCFIDAEEFIKESKDHKIREIVVKGHVEVVTHDEDSKIISPNDIRRVLEDTESELQERKILSPVHASEIIAQNLGKMCRDMLEKANVRKN